MTFPGGVHPPGSKQLTEDCAITQFPTPKTLAIMLGQHIGAPCKALVARRDKVVAGQVIASSDAFVSAPVHSPVSGTVKGIALQSHPVMGRAMAIIIDSDPEADNQKPLNCDKFDAGFDDSQYSPEDIRSAIRDAGVVGMGGAGFPTQVKLEPNAQTPKEAVR